MGHEGRLGRSSSCCVRTAGKRRAAAEDLQHLAAAPIYLRDAAFPRRLVGPPPQEVGAVPEPVSREMVVFHLDDQPGYERLPPLRTAVAPAAGTAGGAAAEARPPLQWLDDLGDLLPFGAVEDRREADSLEQAPLAPPT